MMTSCPDVSVIIPTHKRPSLLQEALTSLLKQSLPNWEAIVVENGSERHAQALIDVIDDARIRYTCLSEGNKSRARNLGVGLAHSEKIAFLDDDDRFLPDKLKHQVRFLDEHPEIGLVASGALLIDAKGQLIREWDMWENTPELTIEKCIYSCDLIPSVILMRKTWYERVGGMDPTLPVVQDTDIFLRLLLSGCSMSWLKETLSEYRIHSGSSQHNLVKYAVCRDRMINKLLMRAELPDSIVQDSENIRQYYDMSGFALCFVAGDYEQGKQYLSHAISRNPQVLEDDGQSIAKALLTAAARREIRNPYQIVQKSVEVLLSNTLITNKVGQKLLLNAAKSSFYRGFEDHKRKQVLHFFPRIAAEDPEWLCNLGTWSILLRSITNRYE